MDGGEEVVCCVVYTRDDATVGFHVGGPEHLNDIIQTILFLEPVDSIGLNVFKMSLFITPSRDQVVSLGFLISH